MESHEEEFEETTSEGSEESYIDESLLNYDETIEPVANEEEAARYAEVKLQEDEEEQRLVARFSQNLDIKEWLVHQDGFM